MIIPRVPVQHRRLLPEPRLSGPTPWVIAILMMLTLLAAAAGVGLARSATAIGEAIFAFLFRPEMIQFERRIAAETEIDPAIGLAFLEAGPWRMKQGFGAWLDHACERGELAIPDPLLAAEQFVSMCKGMGDLERRFGASVSPSERDRRIAGAVEVFLAAYGTAHDR